jgi:hypothetical protein
MRRIWAPLFIFLLFAGAASRPAHSAHSPAVPTDTYEINFGPLIEAIPGEPGLLIPIGISVSQPTVGVNLVLSYDQTLLTANVVAPNMFFQRFAVDLSFPGRIYINLLTDLPPPPEIPPIEGDTILAWISCAVTSEDLGYDLLTHINFYEDPNTPYPDNSLLLEDGTWIIPPNLSLIQGDILIIHPLYGDINLNDYAFEIGDAITFLNFFMGLTEFNRRQYANSDCNRDGIQASIADLVYLLAIVSGDTNLVAPPPPMAENQVLKIDSDSENHFMKMVDNYGRCDIVLQGTESIGGVYFVLEYDANIVEPLGIRLDSSVAPLQLSCTASEGKLMIAVYDWNSQGSYFSSGRLLSIMLSGSNGSGDPPFEVTKAEFSNNVGQAIDVEYNMVYSGIKPSTANPSKSHISVSCYPNPFNGTVSVSYSLPSDGEYDLIVYDILGRKVRTLEQGFLPAGPRRVFWEGTDQRGLGVASGMYFVRLQGEGASASVKVFLLK